MKTHRRLRSLGDRGIYIWGAHYRGISLCRKLKGLGFKVQGFLDKDQNLVGSEVCGLKVTDSADFWAAPPEEAFLILASLQNEAAMAATCRKFGLKPEADYLGIAALQPYNYYVDVAGACNLRCISCPRGNYPGPRPASGFMSAQNYRLVLDKILAEDPLAATISFYDWGEPLLNPDLPEIIALTGERGLDSLISTNLNQARNLEKVVQARPTWLKVSASGYGASYEKTHTGGRWEVFLENLTRLSEYRRKCPEVQVEIGYHLYRHNCGEDRRKMKELAASLGFIFRDVLATLLPYENIERQALGRALTPEAAETHDLLLLPVEEAVARTRDSAGRPCPSDDNDIIVTWDLGVRVCCVWYDPSSQLLPPGEFLRADFAELQKARKNSPVCRRCQSLGLHRLYEAYGDETLKNEKLEHFAAPAGGQS